MGEQLPSIGRIVHFRNYQHFGDVTKAAIIEEVTEDGLTLSTFGATAMTFFKQHKSDDVMDGWSWPPRV